ncbi:hypothetical protein PK69_14410 [Xanthomonas phaseoli pv. phaseoli]|uniref:Uncharacterized protein n=1 Tax=Xanthomonas campestris pv. phaseoli TaxID=317013 RepID=A0AB34QK93_XANCH|nr:MULTISPECIES: hypothetical protein [Xanthomonas]AZU12250.1 hypothetical protein AC609_05875 [Xanthomonas phaseoli pv. phaseoli]AZU25008.1 hypothetical protein AC611_05880 [Xanthomonas phaseoli pv. phaseoli]AZU32509.1 hypothetical protein AC801_22985 [Xanthomonas sp. ISO98C4]AZU33776.1 hypothetical protein AC610_05875 [Xanthomonas phaseoli pv. phaseoli]KGT50652.1 hypothetical protein NZ02_13110 [Xanthomonas phaseoli pv. phaseoli]
MAIVVMVGFAEQARVIDVVAWARTAAHLAAVVLHGCQSVFSA